MQRVDGKEVKKEKGNSSCGEEAEKVVSQKERNVVLDVRCVVEPEKSGDDECGRGDVEQTSVLQMLATVFIGV